MSILANGNVGIGTPTASSKLQVDESVTRNNFTGTGQGTLTIRNIIGTSNYSALDFSGGSSPGNAQSRIASLQTVSGSYLHFGTSNNYANGITNTAMTIDNIGNIGIGLTNPDEKFVVYNGTTTGKYTVSGWTHSSDARLKHDISPIQNSLERILKLQGVEYKFNYDPENKTQIGFVAQEVESIFPEVVVTDDRGFKSMIYSNLVAPLVEAFKIIYNRFIDLEVHQKTQDRQIASIELSKADKKETDDEIKKLKKENATKDKELEAITAYLCSKDPDASICKKKNYEKN